MTTTELIDLHDDDFDEGGLRRPGLWLVEFGAPWCPPCRVSEPILRQLAADLGGTIGVGTVDVDQEVRAAIAHDVVSLPTFVVFKDGRPVARKVGAQPRSALLGLLRNAVEEGVSTASGASR